jgi:hypothetical protein
MGSKAPTFSNDAKSITFVREVGASFGLLCQAQGYPVPIIRQVSFRELILCFYRFKEPVGMKAPMFSSESMSSTFRKSFGQSFNLLCQAQAFPKPSFRQVKLIHLGCRLCFMKSVRVLLLN